jgi:tRNA nucleotidyltransferase (CCA-adding enzyme)
MALALINKFGLYETIFTYPSRELPSKPDTDYFAPAYDFIKSVSVQTGADDHSIVPKTLIRNPDELVCNVW